MPPKRPKKRKMPKQEFRCDTMQGERFHAPTEDVFSFNWWEVFCFPYMLCVRIWDCFVTMIAGTNQCLVYWMIVQWFICKITKFTTPDPIIFPYYFYIFGQVILLTALFAMIWYFIGQTVVIPYFHSFYRALIYDDFDIDGSPSPKVNKTLRMSFRRYCFRKSELFESNEATSVWGHGFGTRVVLLVSEVIFQNVLNRH